MSKVSSIIKVPEKYDRASFVRILRDVDVQVNALSEGRVVATYNATTAAPTTGTYQIGDFVRNSNPSELGSVGSKYIIFGWICTATPNTFKQCRFLTGN